MSVITYMTKTKIFKVKRVTSNGLKNHKKRHSLYFPDLTANDAQGQEIETTPSIFAAILPIIDGLFDMSVVDPFPGNSFRNELSCSSQNVLKTLGLNMIEEDEMDFFTRDCPSADFIITNVPFRYKQRSLERLFEWKKPFAAIVPMSTLHEAWFAERLNDDNSLQIVNLTGDVRYHQQGNVLKSTCFTHTYPVWVLWGNDKKLVPNAQNIITRCVDEAIDEQFGIYRRKQY